MRRPDGRPRVGAGAIAEAVVAVALFAVAVAETVATPSPGLPVALSILALAGVILPIAVSRRRPEVAAAISFGLVLLQAVPAGALPSIAEFIALLVVVGQAAVRVRRFRVGIALLGAAAATALFLRSDTSGSDFAFSTIVTLVPLGLGLAIRVRIRAAAAARERARLAVEQRRERSLLAVREERARIARKLHDVVAHALSVVVVQAAGGRAVLTRDRAAATGAFETIEATGGRALEELERLLGVLGSADDVAGETIGLDGVEGAARLASAAGLPTAAQVLGRPRPLPASVELTVYRIVQEALTNAVRHASGGDALVQVRLGDPLRVTIRNGPGTGSGGPLLPGSGNGILGMRERAALCGGTLRAEPSADGGFLVEAVLPAAAP